MKGDMRMAQYIIAYLGGDQPSSPEEGKRHFAKYKEWLSSLGDSAVSPANPFKNTSTVKPDGTVSTGSTTSTGALIGGTSHEIQLRTIKTGTVKGTQTGGARRGRENARVAPGICMASCASG